MESLFTPVVDEVIKLVHTQAYAVQQEGHQIDVAAFLPPTEQLELTIFSVSS